MISVKLYYCDYQTFVAGGDLELLEETGDDASGGGSGETDLV